MPGKSRKFDAVILDMDGTLFDTETFYQVLWQQTARRAGFILGDTLYKKFIGETYINCLKIVEPLLPAGTGMEDFKALMAELRIQLRETCHITFKPGAEALLEFTFAHFPTALVTSSGRQTVHRYFADTPFLHRFDTVVSFESVARHKPHPEPYLFACKALNVLPSGALVVEDSAHGITAALDAGCQTIIVPDIVQPDPALQERAAGVFRTLDEVRALLGATH